MSEIAQTIANQIGGRAFFMMGTKNRIANGPALTFDVMKNAKKVRYVRVKLDEGRDLYDIEFFRLKRGTHEKIVIADYEGIYAEQLHDLIEKNTGLYLSL